MNRLNIEYIQAENLHRQESNPRLNAQAVEKVQASIREFGFLVPLVVDDAGQIWAGDTRYQAGVAEGMTEFPCVLADQLTEEQLKAFRIADNKVAEAAEWDMEKLTAELAAIEMDMSAFGFDFSQIIADDFGSAFDLPSGEKNPICVMSLTLHERQVATIEEAIAMVKESGVEVDGFGNPNAKGNAVYEVVRQWVEQKKSK